SRADVRVPLAVAFAWRHLIEVAADDASAGAHARGEHGGRLVEREAARAGRAGAGAERGGQSVDVAAPEHALGELRRDVVRDGAPRFAEVGTVLRLEVEERGRATAARERVLEFRLREVADADVHDPPDARDARERVEHDRRVRPGEALERVA